MTSDRKYRRAPLTNDARQQRCVGELLIGPRHSIAAYAEDWSRTLSTFEINLKRDGTVVDYGRASNVLDGPVSALLHLVDILVRDQVNPPLAADEIVTTGTLTRALPVSAGETWATELTGVGLSGLTASVSASLELWW